MSAQVLEVTSVGRVSVTYGFNFWVLVEDERGHSIQRQIRRRSELAELLRELMLPQEEADRAARTFWANRPRDAKDAEEVVARKARNAAAVIILLVVGLLVYVFLDAAGKI